MRTWIQASVPISEIVETEQNANSMTAEDYSLLVENISRSVMSTALTCRRRKEDGKMVIIGGNHRYRAAVQLRLQRVPVQYVEEEELSRDERIALQLSLNSLHGSDNKGILRRLFEEIESLEFKEMAHVDIEEIPQIKLEDANFIMENEHYSVCLILYRPDMKALEQLLELTDEQRRRNDLVLLADGSENEPELMRLKKEIGRRYDISSHNICFCKILQLARKGMEQEKDKEKGIEKNVDL